MAATTYSLARATCILYLNVLLSTSLIGQTTGSLSGKVIDSTGQTVERAVLAAREAATALQVGTYELSVEVPGFKGYRRQGIEVAASSALRADVKMQLGEQHETLTVTGQTIAVESANTGLGKVFSGSTIAATPLNGASFTDLFALQAGVVPASSAQPNAGNDRLHLYSALRRPESRESFSERSRRNCERVPGERQRCR